VHVDGWESDSTYPSGHVMRRLGPIDEIETGIECILIDHQISHPPFTPQQLAHLPVRRPKPVPAPSITASAEWYAWTAPAEVCMTHK